MKDVINCPSCGGNLQRNAHSVSDDYECDCGHRLEFNSNLHHPPEPKCKPTLPSTPTSIQPLAGQL